MVNYFSPGTHLTYLGDTIFELICFAGIKLFNVSNLASYELCRFVVVFGDINLTGSALPLFVMIIIFCVSLVFSGFDSLLLSSRILISMANLVSRSISPSTLLAPGYCFLEIAFFC